MIHTRKLYVMVSNTDTGIGRLIRFACGFPFNHVSVTLDSSFRDWYSFSRYVQDAPFYGGFVRESPERFCADTGEALVRLYAVPIPEKHAKDLESMIPLATRTDHGFIYNYFEAIASYLGFSLPIPQCHTCLSFAASLLDLPCLSIQELCTELEPWLIYEGSVRDILEDSGNRGELYFSRLGLIRGTAISARRLGTLTMRTVYHGFSRFLINNFRRTVR